MTVETLHVVLAIIIAVGTILGAIIVAAWTGSWWLAKQFSGVRHLVHSRIEQSETALEEKIDNVRTLLDKHEDEDNRRFSGFQESIGTLRTDIAIAGLHLQKRA